MKVYKKLILTTCLLVIGTAAFAGPGGPPATPIDGGLSLLLAAGGLYGIKKIRGNRK